MTDPLLRKREDLIKVRRRFDATAAARDSLLEYMRLTMPDPQDPDDVTRSKYQITPQARLLCQIIEKAERREPGFNRVAVSIGPQTGKSAILSRGAPAWLSGRNPSVNCILGSYNQDFANEFGDDVRALVNSSAHKQIFPEHKLRQGGEAKKLLITDTGGKLAFVGVGGSGTGKPADWFFVDDPIKSDEDAQSDIHRERVWNWFTKVANTRIHNDSIVIIVHTRWSEDDLIGRVCDPDHPDRNKKYDGIADDWNYFNLPAVVSDQKLADALGLTLMEPREEIVRKQFGTKPMASLWPERFSLDFLARQKRLDKRGFTALRMGKPSPEDGDYFKLGDIVEYHSPKDLPANLRKYGASDHATSEKRKNDATVIGCVGIDETDDAWVLPDLFWDRVQTDKTVEELLHQFETHRPLLWWMESELVSKSFGPFLHKRMHEKRIYTPIDPVTVSADKRTRARAIQGRMQHRRVHFPAFASWWPDAKNELLKFPYGTHDDFVDWLAHIGMGLVKEIAASPTKAEDSNVIRVGSMDWVLAQTARRERREKAEKAATGW